MKHSLWIQLKVIQGQKKKENANYFQISTFIKNGQSIR